MHLYQSDYRLVIDKLVSQLSSERVLVVSGGRSYDASTATTFFTELGARCNVRRYSGFSPNPRRSELITSVQELKGFAPDLIVAVGGGSVMDFAKLIAIYLSDPEALHHAFIEVRSIEPIAPIVAIPTTAGSGSEATHFAVLYDAGVKHSIAHPGIQPQFVVLDPTLSSTLGTRQTAVSGMDALCQAIESLWAIGSTPESRADAAMALHTILPIIQDTVKRPTPELRLQMLLGAHYAGRAINVSKTTGAHALSYHLTMRYGVPHGEAVGLLMPIFLRLNSLHVRASAVDELTSAFGTTDVASIGAKFIEFLAALDLRTSLEEVAISTRAQVEELVASVNMQRLRNNPRQLSRSEIRDALV